MVGYLQMFELGCKHMGMDEEGMRVSLLMKLTGAAASWAQGLEEGMQYLGYQALKEQLVAHFGG